MPEDSKVKVKIDKHVSGRLKTIKDIIANRYGDASSGAIDSKLGAFLQSKSPVQKLEVLKPTKRVNIIYIEDSDVSLNSILSDLYSVAMKDFKQEETGHQVDFNKLDNIMSKYNLKKKLDAYAFETHSTLSTLDTPVTVKYTDNPEVIIKNLDENFSRDNLRELFHKVDGFLKKIFVYNGKTFAVGSFRNHEIAERALGNLKGHVLNRVTLKCEYSREYKRYLEM
eukprot:GAHX01000217.1.p1 GENE.GAHX01000217.1~~GAHX01000217.1.p1  ORF type:complete len:225 (+),score=45.35 GAHX01000217.1:58-732(+)